MQHNMRHLALNHSADTAHTTDVAAKHFHGGKVGRQHTRAMTVRIAGANMLSEHQNRANGQERFRIRNGKSASGPGVKANGG